MLLGVMRSQKRRATLHTVAAPAVRAEVKTELSYQKIKIMLKLLWPLLLLSSRIMHLIWRGRMYFVPNITTFIQLATFDELRVARRRRLIFGAKLKAVRHNVFYIFHFLQSDIVFGIGNHFSLIFNAVSSKKSCPTSIAFLKIYIDDTDSDCSVQISGARALKE